jgi:hypothetical protein
MGVGKRSPANSINLPVTGRCEVEIDGCGSEFTSRLKQMQCICSSDRLRIAVQPLCNIGLLCTRICNVVAICSGFEPHLIGIRRQHPNAHCSPESASRDRRNDRTATRAPRDRCKKELSGLLEGWASSGFLIWEKFVYPWHQVRTIEVAVESLSSELAAQQMLDLRGADRAGLHQQFWQGARRI